MSLSSRRPAKVAWRPQESILRQTVLAPPARKQDSIAGWLLATALFDIYSVISSFCSFFPLRPHAWAMTVSHSVGGALGATFLIMV
jgi:hypothetical protein